MLLQLSRKYISTTALPCQLPCTSVQGRKIMVGWIEILGYIWLIIPDRTIVVKGENPMEYIPDSKCKTV